MSQPRFFGWAAMFLIAGASAAAPYPPPPGPYQSGPAGIQAPPRAAAAPSAALPLDHLEPAQRPPAPLSDRAPRYDAGTLFGSSRPRDAGQARPAHAFEQATGDAVWNPAPLQVGPAPSADLSTDSRRQAATRSADPLPLFRQPADVPPDVATPPGQIGHLQPRPGDRDGLGAGVRDYPRATATFAPTQRVPPRMAPAAGASELEQFGASSDPAPGSPDDVLFRPAE